MDGERLRRGPSPPPPSPAAAATAVSAVLGNDDLLREILLRLGFPTTLVRAALVCKRWLRLASHPVYLGLFRELHPPRPLCFYVATTRSSSTNCPQFVPMLPQPPELACVLRRGRFSLDTFADSCLPANVMDIRNGSVLISLFLYSKSVRGVHSPLYPERDMVIVPPYPYDTIEGDTLYDFGVLLSKEGSNGVVYFWLSMEFNQKAKATAYVYLFQDGGWHIHTSATIQLPKIPPVSYIVLAHEKIYMASKLGGFLVLDMTSPSFSTIELPDGLVYEDGSTMLSPVDDSGIYLIHVKGLQLNIWLHKGDNGVVNSWLLVDTICLREMFTNLKMSNRMSEGEHTIVININEVGDNAEFVFLRMDESVFYLDLKSRELRKVYEQTEKDRRLVRIRPF